MEQRTLEIKMKTGREHVIERFANDNGWVRGAELGVWKGRTFKHLLRSVDYLELVGVDLYEAQPGNNGPEKWLPGEHGHPWSHEEYYKDILNFCATVGERGEIWKMTTDEAAKQIEDDSLDFVFIDADHSYEGCKGDIENWSPKVKAGGYVMGHDITWPGVKQAVEEFFGTDYKESTDTVWYHIKK
jgi:hypothetical protein